MKSTSWIAFLSILSSGSVISAFADSATGTEGTVAASATTVETTPNRQPPPWHLKANALMSVGSTDNATLLNVPTSGSYARFTPKIDFDDAVSDAIYIDATASGNLKRFSDSAVNSLASESSGSGKFDLAWTVNDSWELGSNLSFAYMQNHIPVVGADSVSAIDQRYYQPESRFYGAWTGDRWSFEAGAGYSTRRYQTTIFDIENNVYHNTYNALKFDGRTGYRISKGLRLNLKSTFEQRDYTERMAEFSEGIPVVPGSGTNPLLKTFAQEHEIQTRLKGSFASYTPSFSVRLEKDEVFGARDSFQFKVGQKAEIPLKWNLSLNPEVSVARQGFSNFRSDPINDPQDSPLRVDWNKQALANLKWAISKTVVAQAQYSFAQKQSNYSLESYSEQSFETGMNVQF